MPSPKPSSSLSAQKLSRLLRLSQMLSCDHFTTKEALAQRLEVSEKTVQRDITALITYFGMPIDISNQGYILTERCFPIPTTTLTERELFALLIAEKTLSEYRGTPFDGALTGAFYKLTALLDDDVQLDLSRRGEAFHIDFDTARPVNAEVMQAVSEAYSGKKTLVMDYYSASRDSSERRQVDIYKILNQGGDWYVIGHCHKRQEVRVFALSRMRNAAVFDTDYVIPDDFDMEEYLGKSFAIERGERVYDVAIWFDEYQARWIRERTWQESQRIEEGEDGSLTTHFQVSGLREVLRWVLSYGEHVKVLSPPELVVEVQRNVQALRGRYGKM